MQRSERCDAGSSPAPGSNSIHVAVTGTGYGRDCKSRTYGFESRPPLRGQHKSADDPCKIVAAGALPAVSTNSSDALVAQSDRAPSFYLGTVRVRVLPRAPHIRRQMPNGVHRRSPTFKYACNIGTSVSVCAAVGQGGLPTAKVLLAHALVSEGHTNPGPAKMPLTDTQLRSAKKRARPYRKSDGGGLYLLVRTNGAKDWRLAYQWRGKQRTLALGAYPAVSLAAARQARTVAKSDLAKGISPSDARKERAKAALIAAGNTFERIAREWHGLQKPSWSQDYADTVLCRMEADVFPAIGRLPVATIEPTDVLDMLRNVEARGEIDLAHRLKQQVGMVFRFGVATGRASRDPSADLKGALKSVVVEFRRRKTTPRHEPPRIPRIELPGFLRSLGAYDGEQRTRLALGLIVLTFVHTQELCTGRWDELEGLDGPEPLWRIPAERLTSRREHLVPLSRQAAAVLRGLRKLAGDSPFMFPSANADGSMSEDTCLQALCGLGYHGRATVHGLQSVADTVLKENGFDSAWIECQFAHEEGNAAPAVRDAAEWLPERRRMMQWWADYLDALICEDDNVATLARAS